MKTPYGEYNVGDVYVPADGSNYQVTIVDVETFADKEDIVIKAPNGTERRIDWFKFSYRYEEPEHRKKRLGK